RRAPSLRQPKTLEVTAWKMENSSHEETFVCSDIHSGVCRRVVCRTEGSELRRTGRVHVERRVIFGRQTRSRSAFAASMQCGSTALRSSRNDAEHRRLQRARI